VWVCDRAGGSILAAGVTHAAANTVMAFLPLQSMRGLYLTYGIAALIVTLVARMWKRLPQNHPAVKGGGPAASSSASQGGSEPA
jgi:hypothetical protein